LLILSWPAKVARGISEEPHLSMCRRQDPGLLMVATDGNFYLSSLLGLIVVVR
jgi:hypothetical protein